MAERVSYIVEIDEKGNPSVKYADGTLYTVNITDYSAEVLKQLVPRKINYTVTHQIDGLYIAAQKGTEKFLLPYSPKELMETIEDRESIQYMLDGTSVELIKNGNLNSFYEFITSDIVAVDSEETVNVKENITEVCIPHNVEVETTFSEGTTAIECNVTVKIGELEFGPILFTYEKLAGGDTDVPLYEGVALPEAD